MRSNCADSSLRAGEGDATAASIDADAYNRGRCFYLRFHSMLACKQSIDGSHDVTLPAPDGGSVGSLKSEPGAAAVSG